MRSLEAGYALELLDELGGRVRREAKRVPARVELDDVGADGWPGEGLHEADGVAHSQPTGLGVRDAGGEGRIEAVKVNRHIEWARQFGACTSYPRSHIDRLDTEAPGLLMLMTIGRADADLHQARGEAPLHDACERAGVREAAALELVVEVGVRIDVEDGQARETRPEPSWLGSVAPVRGSTRISS